MEKHEEVSCCYSFVVISAVYSRFSMVTAISIRFLAEFLAMMITLGWSLLLSPSLPFLCAADVIIPEIAFSLIINTKSKTTL